MLKTQFEKTNKKLDQIANSSKSNDQKEIQIDSAYNQYFKYLRKPLPNQEKRLREQYYNDLTKKVNIMKDHPDLNSKQVQAYIALQKNINSLENNPDIMGVELKRKDNLFKDLLNDNKNQFRKPALEKKWKDWEIAYERNNKTPEKKIMQQRKQISQRKQIFDMLPDSDVFQQTSYQKNRIKMTQMKKRQRKKRAQKILRTSLFLLGIVLCLIAIYFLYIQLRKRLQGNRVVEEEPVIVVEEEPVIVVEEEPVVVVEDVIEDVVEDVVEENNSFFFFLVFLSLLTIYYFKFNKKKKTKTKSRK